MGNKKLIAKIQETILDNGVLPYPYFILKNGSVDKQDIWNGKPFRLIGFSNKPTPGLIDLNFDSFRKNIKKAIGLYAVFENKNKQWFTRTIPIKSIEL